MSTNAFLRAAGLGLGALFAVTTTIACGPAGETGTGGSGGSGSGGSGGSGGTGGDACVIGEPTAQATMLTKLAEPDFGLWSGMEHREGDLLLFEQGKLVSVPVAGGAAVTLASDATIESFSFFAAVAGDAVIYAGNDLQLRSLPLAGARRRRS